MRITFSHSVDLGVLRQRAIDAVEVALQEAYSLGGVTVDESDYEIEEVTVSVADTPEGDVLTATVEIEATRLAGKFAAKADVADAILGEVTDFVVEVDGDGMISEGWQS